MNESSVSDPITLSYDSDDLDLLQIGVLNKSLHNLLNQVAIAMLDEENQEREKAGKPRLITTLPTTFTREDVLIRARLVGLHQGSIVQDLQPVLAAVASNPHAVAILQNLAANVIWAIGEFGVRVSGVKLSHRLNRGRDRVRLPGISARRRLSAKVVNLVKEIKEAGNGGRLVIKTRDEELIIELNAPARRPDQHHVDDE